MWNRLPGSVISAHALVDLTEYTPSFTFAKTLQEWHKNPSYRACSPSLYTLRPNSSSFWPLYLWVGFLSRGSRLRGSSMRELEHLQIHQRPLSRHTIETTTIWGPFLSLPRWFLTQGMPMLRAWHLILLKLAGSQTTKAVRGFHELLPSRPPCVALLQYIHLSLYSQRVMSRSEFIGFQCLACVTILTP